MLDPRCIAADAAAAFARAGFVCVAEFGAEEYLLSSAGFLEPAAQEELVGFWPVDVGCVPECDARFVVSRNTEVIVMTVLDLPS